MNAMRVMWVDDLIHQFDRYISVIRNQGHRVDTYDTSHAAIQALREEKYDYAFVDLLMPGKLGMDVIDAFSDTQEEGVAVALSSYARYGELRPKGHVRVVDKVNLFHADSDEEIFEVLFEEDEEACDPVESRPLVQFSYDDYSHLTAGERTSLLRETKSLLNQQITNLFQQGHSWVMFCGSNNPAVTIPAGEEPLDSESIHEFARSKGFAPLCFASPFDIDDLSWGAACEGDNANYPTISYAIDRKTFTSHFDTGSPTSFFDASQFDIDGSTTLITVKGEDVGATYKTLNVKIVDQQDKSTAKGSIGGYFCEEWKSANSPFRRACPPACTTAVSGLCKYRDVALVGRNVQLTNTRAYLVADFNKARTIILTKDPKAKNK